MILNTIDTTTLTGFASEAAGSAEAASGFGALGVDLKAFIVQFITFLIVFFILKKYVFSKIVEVLDKRQNVIEEGVKSAQAMTEQKEKLEKEVAKMRSEARKQADEIIAESRNQAEDIVAKAELATTAKTDKMLADAKVKINEETEKSRRGLKAEIVSLVVDTTEKLIGSKVDTAKDQQIIDEAVKSSANANKGNK